LGQARANAVLKLGNPREAPGSLGLCLTREGINNCG
jgi:hypothetical protein